MVAKVKRENQNAKSDNKYGKKLVVHLWKAFKKV